MMLPFLPRVMSRDITRFSRRGSMAGLVTCMLLRQFMEHMRELAQHTVLASGRTLWYSHLFQVRSTQRYKAQTVLLIQSMLNNIVDFSLVQELRASCKKPSPRAK
jgi:hypothetical protein